MAPSRSEAREAKLARARLKGYTARQTVHSRKITRRRRDNVIATVVGVLVITLAVFTQVAYFSSGPGAPAPDPSASPEAEGDADITGSNVGDIPSPDLAENRLWTGELTLNDVDLAIELDGVNAPQAVAVFVQEVEQDYFPGKICHRLTNGGAFILQCGSLDGTGAGDPSFSFGPIENAPADDFYPAGTIAMARGGGDAYSNGHQFFIIYEDTTIPSDSAGGYSVIGTITAGLDALKTGVTDAGLTPGSSETDGSPIIPTTISNVTLN